MLNSSHSTHHTIGHAMTRMIIALVFGCQLLLQAPLLPAAAEGKLPVASDLRQDGVLAAGRGIPILLVVSREHCAYCRRLKREVLEPVQRSGNYTQRVILRELMIDPGMQLIDFQGKSRSAASLATSYHVSLTPTLLFLDPAGQELTGRIVGVNTLEMFSLYLDEAIDEARQRLHSTADAARRPR